MNSFLKRADFSGKQVCIVTFQQSRFLQGSGKVHRYIAGLVERRNGAVRACCALLGAPIGHNLTPGEIEPQLASVPPPSRNRDLARF